MCLVTHLALSIKHRSSERSWTLILPIKKKKLINETITSSPIEQNESSQSRNRAQLHDSAYLFNGMQRSSMAADASPDYEQVVVECLGRASIVGERGGDEELISTAYARGGRQPESERIWVSTKGGEPEGLASETAKAEVQRLGRWSEGEGFQGIAIWSLNGEWGVGRDGDT